MELHVNSDAPLTRWLVANRLLPSPFVLLDVGVQGGPHPRWEPLGPQLHVYGFDAIDEAVAPLKARNTPNHHYFAMALGNEEGQRRLHLQSNRYASSFYSQAPSRFEIDERVWREDGVRTVPIRRLDSLLDEGLIPPADFIKLDCEGFEPDVLKGAQRFLKASDLVGADLETNFNVSPVLPETHFWSSYQPLLHKRLLLFDVAFNRVPRASYATHLDKRPDSRVPRALFRPGTWNVLLARDLIQDRESPGSFPWMPDVLVDADAVLKSIIIFELYGLIDWAYDYLLTFSDLLRPTIDVDAAVRLLVPDAGPGTPHDPGIVRRLLSRWRRA